MKVGQVGKKKLREQVRLPDKPKEPVLDPSLFTVLLYGREKIGKTTLLSQWPDALFLTTEPGTKGLEIYEIAIGNWSRFLGAVKALEADRSRFKTIVIDTVDLAYDMCLDHVCSRLGITYPGEDERGRQDYGKSWRAVRDEFVHTVTRIIRTGRGVCFISHAAEASIRSRSGSEYDRVIPSLSKQGRRVVEALVDIIMFADYFRDTRGNTLRVLVCNGDETVYAGHRKTAGKFPTLLPLEEDGGYKVFLQGFRGQHPGISPTELMSTPQTAKAAGKLLRKLVAERLLNNSKRKKLPAKRRRR